MVRTAVRTGGACVVAVSLALALLVVGAPKADAATRPTAEVLMVQRINDTRVARGLPRLVPNLQMKRIARQWTNHMAAVNSVYHRPNLASVVYGPYDRLAENVGYTRLAGVGDAELVKRLHKAFMASDGHRAHILGRFNMVGVGMKRQSNGRMWVTVNFLKGPIGSFPLYVDADGSSHERAIGSLFVRGAVRGCKAANYCPKREASRKFVAVTFDRAKRTNAASRWLNARCGTSKACRHGDITKVQLAKMLAKVLNLDAASGSRFTDVRSGDKAEVYAVVRADLMGGCSRSRFCPGRAVSRAAAATIVNRTLR